MTTSILLLILGFALLISGANWLVNGASAFAKKKNISDLAIGLTIVAFGTSAPELVVNSIAAFQSSSDIVFGNIIGSNNFNLFAILGIVGLISPIVVQSTTVWREIPISLFAALALLILSNSFLTTTNILSRTDGLFLLIMFGLFLRYVYTQMKSEKQTSDPDAKTLSNTKIWAFITFGFAGLIFGGELVVDNATSIAVLMGVSQKVIGLTIIAAGTSLPELVTSVVAATKKNSDIAIGNIIGSNIFNVLFIISISSLIKPVAFNTDFNYDLYLLIGGTILLFIAMFTGQRKRLDRWEAGILLSIYISRIHCT